MSDAPLVLLEREGRLAWLTLNRPQVRNALSHATLLRMRALLAELRVDREVWAVAIRGAGDQAFCAGADLKERRSMNEEQVAAFVRDIRGTMDDVAALPQPTLAVINGHAFGGGCEMALACDLRILAADAQIGLTETSLAIIPGAGGCARLPRLVGGARAKQMILLAERLNADQALAIGLVHEVAPAGQTQAAAERMLQELTSKGPLALQAAKEAIDQGIGRPLVQALELEAACYQRIIPTADRLEALAAFAEKRAPRFEGR